MKRLLLVLTGLVLLSGLAACGQRHLPTVQYPAAIRALPEKGPYHSDQPTSLTLLTVDNNSNGRGAHSALLINASQQVIFDPAGSFHHPQIRREGDVLVGIDPVFLSAYERMHARPTFHVRRQTIQVPPEVAEKALKLAFAEGPVGDARCAHSISGVLAQLPGFAGIGRTWFPNSLASEFQSVTGVAGTLFYEDFTPPGGNPALRSQVLPYRG
ncbi:hypothetical protein KM176_13350 [Pseudooceanicola sp. CBS1P-1]|uniref:Lipoprotein n=1 Tax=Pseudooceanicola albus TaxID=2692189 RepID=A0A6L7G3X9_9RHOB|nr:MULTISPECIES: hypothetical protein [Pseudooceanicola]MBT9384850.1 hypothetical protein [Pseudooceanicola endophyticus]MXN18156.1 hypothetical protein [Pseudooceanicola albus]